MKICYFQPRCVIYSQTLLSFSASGVDSADEDSGDSSDDDEEDSRRSRLQHNGGLGHHRQIPLHRQQPQKDQPPTQPPFEVSNNTNYATVVAKTIFIWDWDWDWDCNWNLNLGCKELGI